MLTSLAWFLVRSHSALAPPRVLPATRGTCLCRHGMPATDRNGRRRRSTATDRSGGREAIAGYGQRLGPTSPAPAPSALGLFTRPASTQRIDHHRSWQPRTEFLYPTRDDELVSMHHAARGFAGSRRREPSRRPIGCVVPSGSESSPARRRGKTCPVTGRLGQEHPYEGGHQWPPPIRPRHRSWTLARRAFLPASRPRPV